MKGSFRHALQHPAIAVAFAVVWLPYVSTARCVHSPFAHGDCGMLDPGSHDLAVAEAGPHMHHHGPHALPEGTPRRHSPVHTCCELTGKTNVTLSSPDLLPAPAAAVFALTPPALHVPSAGIVASLPTPVANSPPLFLRICALLI